MTRHDEILATHNKDVSGVDFPAFISELVDLDVQSFVTYVADGHTIYTLSDGEAIRTDPKYATRSIAPHCNEAGFREKLLLHQSGITDFFTFCIDAAQCGIANWEFDIEAMACTYHDINGNEVMTEVLPIQS
ncbi:MAG: DUF1398 family protein [Bacteroidetes bacterium]|nr:DUF1398 family protein [Bacteroidota bacterium]